MKYDQFVREKRSRYELFAKTIAEILQSAIRTEPRDFRLQQITHRAKDPASLERKLTERGLLESNSIEQELKDLAGCRLIFYTNTDVDRFLNSRLIFDNFVVDFDGSKIHHAVGTERSADELYFAIHYLVSLTEGRLSLPEYAKFRGMRCEVQLQTILNHAWAETSHDIVYHPTPIEGFGTKQFAAIKKRLEKIMNQYLLPAGYEFQKVEHDYERLLEGKVLFDRGTLEALGTAKDNNERHEQLERVRKDLLPFYDDVPAIAPEVIHIAADTIKRARDTARTPIETPFGNFHGHTAEDVTNKALQLIDDLRYVDIDLTFRVLCDLYITARSDEEHKRVLQSFDVLARNDLNAWRQVGFGVQKVLYDAIVVLPEAEKTALRPVIATMCSLFLDTELQGTTWHFDSVSLQRGAAPASDAYGEFRRNVLTLLFDQYRRAASTTDKMQSLQALNAATRFPMDGGQADLIEVVLDDTRRIVEFFTEQVEGEPFEIVQHLEHQFLWLYRRSKEMAAGHGESAIPAKAEAVAGSIKSFRDRANANDRFVKFKTLVGFESVFPLEWDGDPMDIEGPQDHRASQITQCAESVTVANADEWYSVIELCAAVKSNDLATFPSFGEFLKQLAARSPAVVISYLEKNEELLSNFLSGILAGLAESAQPDVGVSLTIEWIDQGRHLHAIAHYLRFAENLPVDLMTKVGEKAIKRKDTVAVIGVIAAIIARQIMSLVETVFVPAIHMLTELKDARWVNEVWYLPKLGPFLEGLSEQQSDVLLANLVLRERVDHHDESVLRAIATKYPRPVLQFFKARIDRKDTSDVERRYEPVPYHMADLGKSLARDAKLVVRSVREWYSSDNNLFTYSGGKLLQNIFPGITQDYEAELLALIRTETDDDIHFVLSVLASYRGTSSLQELCKALVEALPEGDKRIRQVEIILNSTGVVSGEFGMVQAYHRKKEEMQTWLDDARAKVRAFAEAHVRSLDRTIAAEQRKSEADHEMRRMEWPEEE